MALEGWYPRPSSMGYYFSCDYRAALDRAVAEGIAADEAATMFTEKQAAPSPNADLGTCIHFTMQDGMGCTFGKPDPQPTPSQWQNASLLFEGDLDRTKRAAFAAATLAASHMPALPAGEKWLAEIRAGNRFTQGTIDFLSPDGDILGDLKTTSKPPLGGAIKPPHLYQIITYRWLRRAHRRVMPRRGFVIYVDAINAAWCHRIDLDFTDPALEELVEHVEQYARYLRSNSLYRQAVPRLGSHCSDDWCPYTKICKQRYLKPLSTGFGAKNPLPTAAAPSLDTLAKV